MSWFNLEKAEFAYIFGFLQTDGHLHEATRNRSCIYIEIASKDKEILEKVQNILPIKCNMQNRCRDTNFMKNCETSVLTIHNYNFKEHIKKLGLPAGKKSRKIKEPTVPFSEIDYWRGIIDGDGSLGITKTGLPFISLTTDSEFISKSFIIFIQKICGGEMKQLNRNKRDDIYNISIFREKAQSLIKCLYYENCFALQRKKDESKKAMGWIRPKSMRRCLNNKFWTPEQDEFILNHSTQESMAKLKRSKNSVTIRRCKISKINSANS